jgi:hypothetical protein
LTEIRNAFSKRVGQSIDELSKREDWIMTIIPTMRAGTLAIVLAAGALAGCSSPGGMVASTNRSIVPTASRNAAPYSGEDYAAALDSVMTTDSSGE